MKVINKYARPKHKINSTGRLSTLNKIFRIKQINTNPILITVKFLLNAKFQFLDNHDITALLVPHFYLLSKHIKQHN